MVAIGAGSYAGLAVGKGCESPLIAMLDAPG